MDDFRKDYTYVNIGRLVRLKQSVRDHIIEKDFDLALMECEEILTIRDKDCEAILYKAICQAHQVKSLENTEDVNLLYHYIYNDMGGIRSLDKNKQEPMFKKVANEMVAYVKLALFEVRKADAEEKTAQEEAGSGYNAFLFESVPDDETEEEKKERLKKKIIPVEKLKDRANILHELLLNLYSVLVKYKMTDVATDILVECEGIREENPLIFQKDMGKKKKLRKLTAILLGMIFLLLLFLVFLINAIDQREQQDLEPTMAEQEAEEKETVEESLHKLVRPVAVYYNDEKCTGRGARYVEGSGLELLMDDCAYPTDSPTLLVGEGLDAARHYYSPTVFDFSSMQSFNMGVHFTEAESENGRQSYRNKYAFSESGAAEFMKDILSHMTESSLINNYPVNSIYQPILEDAPVFHLAEEKRPCYYAYIHIRFKGMTYLYNVYMKSDDGSVIDDFSAEFISARYILAEDDEARLQLKKLDVQAMSNLLIFAEAVEHVMTGSHQINHWLDTFEGINGSVKHSFETDKRSFRESFRFVEANGPTSGDGSWRDARVFKCEFHLWED